MSRQTIPSLRRRIDDALATFLDEQIEQIVRVQDDPLASSVMPSVRECYDIIRAYTLRGGKRLRPLALLLSYRAAGGTDIEKALLPAVGIELLHTYSLILDDLMDEDDLRRSHPSVHAVLLRLFDGRPVKKDIHPADPPLLHGPAGTSPGIRLFAGQPERFAASFSIMMANVTMLLSRKAFLVSSSSPGQRLAMLQLVNRADELLYHGQMMDMAGEQEASLSREWYLKMIQNKTGTLFGLAFQLGSLLAGNDQGTQGTYWQTGMELARGFQIRDDLKDVKGTKGRKKGTDIIKRKKTLLFIEAMDRADKGQQQVLKSIFSKPAVTDRQVKEVIAIMEQTGAVEACRSMVRRSLTEARSLVEDIAFSHDDLLKSFLSQMVEDAS
ncbi:MAG: polyprenyl synthetase family protein [DPANN group archaeon]|nr:polyprenyl synthetase family protein [DPANN group archaeon]